MGLSNNLFFDRTSNEGTLSSRITLLEEQITPARSKKDELLSDLKHYLANKLRIEVKHWIQGSYKNHTLIRPVRINDEFDIDIGIYLLFNAEEHGVTASDAKSLHRKALEEYSKVRPDTQLEPPKDSCERLSYPQSFHIDLPLYYFDTQRNICRLATQDSGWINSDPKALQDWFDITVAHLSPASLAQLRRIIKYLKTWTSLKKNDSGVQIPSIALTVLVAQHYQPDEHDDDAFIKTTRSVMDYILSNKTLPSPTGSGDLFGFDDEKQTAIRKSSQTLKSACDFIAESTDSLQQYILWIAIFEHMFPPFSERHEEVDKKTNLPAITTPPLIRVQVIDAQGNLKSNSVTDSVVAFKGESLKFSIDNRQSFDASSKIHWTVKNQNKEALLINDLGHTTILNRDQQINRNCSYNGVHYMECLVLDGNNIKGISCVKVKISGLNRPNRNPPRKNHFRGRR